MSNTVEFLLHATQTIVVSRYMSGAALTLLLYDWMLVAKDEAMTIWQSQWSLPKTIYYFIRIITIPGMILSAYELSDQRGPLSDSFCAVWTIFVTVPMWLCFTASSWLFTLRLIALYKRRRVLTWFINIFFVATYGATLGFLISMLLTYRKTVAYFPAFNSCGSLTISSSFPAMFYAPAAYEAFIFALTAYQAYKDAELISDSASSPLLIVLYRDGLICFLVMLGMRSWNIWIFATQPAYSYALGGNIMWATNAVMSTRVYLNLVWLARRQPFSTIGTNDPRTGASIEMRPPTLTDSTLNTSSTTYTWRSSLPTRTQTTESA